MAKNKDISQADLIREYVLTRKFEPARQRGEEMITLFAREVHAEMHLNAPVVAVCSALDHDGFEEYAGVRLLERSGRRGSAKSKWVFGLNQPE
jgi:hypothetical protein